MTLVCVFIFSYWYSSMTLKNRKQKHELKRNQLLIEQKAQIEELKIVKQELTARNAFLSNKITDLEEEKEEVVRRNRDLHKTILGVENQTNTGQTSTAPESNKTEQAGSSKSKTVEELGFDALMERNFDMALAYLHEAIKSNPNNSNTYDYMGIAYANKGKYVDAIEVCQKAIDCNCEDATAFYIMGLALQKLGYHERAEECFQIKDIIRKR